MINYYLRKIIHIIRRDGIIGGIKFIIKKLRKKNEAILVKRDLFRFYSYVLLNEEKSKLSDNGNDIRLAWFIPDFGIGSGGHLNIFRFIYHLEKNNIQSDIYICGDSQWGNESSIKEIINKHFFSLKSNVYVVSTDTIQQIELNYHLAIATSWQTAYYVRAFDRCINKAYFVQDFEPYFYPLGSSYSFAEETYKFGFYGITAGDWLKDKLSTEYGMTCTSFSFSYDKDLYRIHQRREPHVRRLFFYTRPPTDRRGFELGILSLNEFCKHNNDVEVVMAGWDVSEYEIPFKHFNAGVVRIEELSHLYSQCDAALILSFTNLSLLPLELIASGCPIIINSGKNNSWLDPNEEKFIFVNPDVKSISSTLNQVFNGSFDTKRYLSEAKKYLESSSWEKEASKILKSIYEIVEAK